MFIEIENSFKPELTERLIKAADFYAELLLHKKMSDNIFLTIKIDPDLDVQGCCSPEDGNSNRPRDFLIEIRANDEDDDYIRTLAHEMVHLKQYAKGELGKDGIVFKKNEKYQSCEWKGEPYLFKRKDDKYWDAPWEIEAYGRELGLFRRFQECCGEL